jgi:F0F1-type ATP synthase assembly protein I
MARVMLVFYALGLAVSIAGAAVFGVEVWNNTGAPVTIGVLLVIPIVDFCVFFWRHRKDET